MKQTIITAAALIIFGVLFYGCTGGTNSPQAADSPAPSPSADTVNVTLEILDSLLTDKAATAEVKSKVRITEEQIGALRKISSDEVAKLNTSNAADRNRNAEEASARVLKSISDLIGDEKCKELMTLAADHWSAKRDAAAAKELEPTMLKGPNAVPSDTRIVVNIPSFRMDVFRDGTLLKSFKIGIGYQEFPLPTGFRKAEMIIFNPTWTQPNESWASNPGQVVPAGDKGNPLGPIKIPIGGANLIHGGKALAKIGTFASHGCVGLTNEEVKDFAKVLAQATNTELKEETMAAYLKKKTRTQVVKLSKPVPVELRYETIVIQEGQLHIYRDVYNKNTNTEENLRAAFAANGVEFDTLSEAEKTHALEALNAMSLRPKKQPSPKPASTANQNSADKRTLAAERKAEAERQRQLRNRKENVIEIASLSGKGYPATRDLNTGAGPVTLALAIEEPKPTRPRPNPSSPSPTPRVSPTPAPQPSPEASPLR